MPTRGPTITPTRYYARDGKVAHVSYSDPTETECNRPVRSFLGTGSQAEYDKAASLPRCQQCVRATSYTSAYPW